jgi:hypothetical protein
MAAFPTSCLLITCPLSKFYPFGRRAWRIWAIVWRFTLLELVRKIQGRGWSFSSFTQTITMPKARQYPFTGRDRP